MCFFGCFFASLVWQRGRRRRRRWVLALRLLAARGSTPTNGSSSCFGPDCGSSVFIYVFHLFNSKRRLPGQRCLCRSVCLVAVAFAFSVSAPLQSALPPRHLSPSHCERRICLLWFWRFSSLNAFELIYNLLMLMYLCCRPPHPLPSLPLLLFCCLQAPCCCWCLASHFHASRLTVINCHRIFIESASFGFIPNSSYSPPPPHPSRPPLTLIALLDVIVMVPIFLAAAVADAVAVVVDVVIVKRFLGLIYEAGQAAYLAAQRSNSVQSPLLPHTRQAASSSSCNGCSTTVISIKVYR